MPETDFSVLAEHLSCQEFQRSLQVCQRDMFAYYQAFHLRELMRVCGIVVIPAIHLARAYHLDVIRCLLLQNLHLDCRCMRPQQVFGINIKGILHITGGMVSGDISAFKAIQVLHHFRTFDDLVAKAHKQILQLLLYQCQWMQTSCRRPASWESHVNFLTGYFPFQFCCFQRLFSFFQCFLQFLLEFVYFLTISRFFICRQVLHILHQSLNRTFFSKVLHPKIIQGRGSISRSDVLQSCLLQLLHLIHIYHPLFKSCFLF